jgi:hypothetical protein
LDFTTIVNNDYLKKTPVLAQIIICAKNIFTTNKYIYNKSPIYLQQIINNKTRKNFFGKTTIPILQKKFPCQKIPLQQITNIFTIIINIKNNIFEC